VLSKDGESLAILPSFESRVTSAATVLLLNHKEAPQASKARRHAFATQFQRGLYEAIFRRPRSLLHFDSWDGRSDDEGHALATAMQSSAIWRSIFTDEPS